MMQPRALPTRAPWRVVAVTYELGDDRQWRPVVRHEFFGSTAEDAIAVYRAHLKTDRFLASCTNWGAFDGIHCNTVLYPPERTG